MNLILSLLFGFGQLIIGGILALRMRRWHTFRIFVLFIVSLWFVGSGTTEIIVSGMETCQRLIGTPDASTFTLWRGRADAALLAFTVALSIFLCTHPIRSRLFSARTGGKREQ
ncbi:MAG: hypothetical protein OJF49_000091 [Ktedonobacterales bacterium]|nr:MAG: hypothetical protein OJF49_000091 [Ktedonobacterales bacterium]